MNEPNEPKIDTKRRTLITAAACAPAIAVGVLLTRHQPAQAVSLPATDDAPPESGYHETEHIRKYYRSAAF